MARTTIMDNGKAWEEGTTPTYQGTLLDEQGSPVQSASFSAVRLTLYSLGSQNIINGRNGQNVLNTNGVSIHPLTGQFQWKLAEADMILTETPKPAEGIHRAVLVFEWLDGAAVPRQLTHEVDFPITTLLKASFSA